MDGGYTGALLPLDGSRRRIGVKISSGGLSKSATHPIDPEESLTVPPANAGFAAETVIQQQDRAVAESPTRSKLRTPGCNGYRRANEFLISALL